MSDLILQIPLPSSQHVVLRALKTMDVQKLTMFLENLSSETRRLSTFPSYDSVTAQEFCDVIDKYDKQRYVLETPAGELVGLLEFCMDVPESDKKRFKKYNIELDSKTDCRFGPTLADSYQNMGIGSIIFPKMMDVVREMGKRRVLLYGGVLVNNARAIHFYEKNGFLKLGTFINSDGKECLDMMLELFTNK